MIQDTEYPGTVYLPAETDIEFEYQMVRANCDHLKLIQVGICLTDHNGNYPPGPTHAWQFNLEFDEKIEQSRQQSMELLRDSGLDFSKHKTDGIPHSLFA